ncbi:hypothetical protein SAMN05444157_3338 [Frankineae bacterium MT45]|nr:hypothetical protein SAMN05444157_3338 [Frankineae bacterium MT45]
MQLTTQLAQQLIDQAQRDAEAQFNRQHALAGEGELALRRITDDGAKLKATEAAAKLAGTPALGTDTSPFSGGSSTGPARTDTDEMDDDEQPSRWLT